MANELQQLDELLKSVGARVRVGLRDQGHWPTVLKMRADGKDWDEIGRTIGWIGSAVQAWYYREKLAEAYEARSRADTLRAIERGLHTELATERAAKLANKQYHLGYCDGIAHALKYVERQITQGALAASAAAGAPHGE